MFIDIAIKAFSYWYEEVKADKYCDPLQVFERMMANEERISNELSLKFDQVILDALMYADVGLTKVFLFICIAIVQCSLMTGM